MPAWAPERGSSTPTFRAAPCARTMAGAASKAVVAAAPASRRRRLSVERFWSCCIPPRNCRDGTSGSGGGASAAGWDACDHPNSFSIWISDLRRADPSRSVTWDLVLRHQGLDPLQALAAVRRQEQRVRSAVPGRGNAHRQAAPLELVEQADHPGPLDAERRRRDRICDSPGLAPMRTSTEYCAGRMRAPLRVRMKSWKIHTWKRRTK